MDQPWMEGPDWELVTSAAEWEPRDSCARLVHNDHLWIMGGWFHQSEPNPRDVWKSPDGKHWEKALHEAPWTKSDLPAYYTYKGRMWHMGGRSLPGTECSREVYSTVDGVEWDLVTPEAAWSARLGMGMAVFKGKMWMFGGTASFYEYNDETMKSDIWSSEDGATWTLEADDAPWGKRPYNQVVVLNDALYLMGGGAWFDAPVYNDVWRSTDGVNWECIQESAPWCPRIWHGAQAYRGCLWVMAGDSLQGEGLERMQNDVWFSRDGVEWTEMRSDKIFSKRHEVTTYVFQDKLWLAAGHALPLSNEVWSLSLPEDF